MKRVLLVALLLLPSVAAPLAPLPMVRMAQAQPPKTKAGQIDAVDQWAGVIRRCKTAKVMWEVADLLQEVCDKIDNDRSMLMEFNFRLALHKMQSAAKYKAGGLDSGNKMNFDLAEQLIKQALQQVRQ